MLSAWSSMSSCVKCCVSHATVLEGESPAFHTGHHIHRVAPNSAAISRNALAVIITSAAGPSGVPYTSSAHAETCSRITLSSTETARNTSKNVVAATKAAPTLTKKPNAPA